MLPPFPSVQQRLARSLGSTVNRRAPSKLVLPTVVLPAALVVVLVVLVVLLERLGLLALQLPSLIFPFRE